MMRQAIVFRHHPGEDLSSFSPILRQCGYEYRYINTPKQPIPAEDILKADLLIIMGGPMGVYEADAHPYLLEEIKVARARLEKDKPVLGVCLGAQIVANALGAAVYPGPNGKEVGWLPIQLTDEGKNSPLAHLAPEKTSMFHWHGDTFDLPKGAVRLASSALYENQAFRFGRNTLGVQFHPEVSEVQISGTFEHFVDDLYAFGCVRTKIAELDRDTAAYAATLERQNALFMQAWLESLSHA